MMGVRWRQLLKDALEYGVPWIKAVQVPAGFGLADRRLTAQACAGEVFVTSDVPLAALAEKKAWVIDLRGDLIDYTTLQSRLHIN
jgi:uncharacterized protein YaiI (UPF0178 family)